MEAKQHALSKISDSNSTFQKFEKAFQVYQDSLIYSKSCANEVEEEEEAIVREFKRYILEESKPKENDTTEMKLHWEDKKKFAAYYPRLISLKGFKELFEVTGQNSKLKRS